MNSLSNEDKSKAQLILVGSCRNDEDESRVNELKKKAEALEIKDKVR